MSISAFLVTSTKVPLPGRNRERAEMTLGRD
jgi:hypothetical protein